jgi:hypothetical protein
MFWSNLHCVFGWFVDVLAMRPRLTGDILGAGQVPTAFLRRPPQRLVIAGIEHDAFSAKTECYEVGHCSLITRRIWADGVERVSGGGPVFVGPPESALGEFYARHGTA